MMTYFGVLFIQFISLDNTNECEHKNVSTTEREGNLTHSLPGYH